MAWWATLHRIERPSIRSGFGLGLLMAVAALSLLASPPALRWPVLGAIGGGVIVGGAWILWRRRRPLESRTPPLNLGPHEGRRPPR